MKILFLYSRSGAIITGGQKYDYMLYEYLGEISGIEVERRCLDNANTKLRRYRSVFSNLLLAKDLRKYDLVIANSTDCFCFALLFWLLKLLGVKTAVLLHHFLFHGAEGIRRLYCKSLEGNFLKASSSIIVPSPYINDLCRKMYPRKEVYYWQIPFEQSPSVLPANPIPGNLLYIGTIEHRKGLLHLIEAMTLLKNRGVDCRLTIVGKIVSQAYKDMLDAKIAENKLNVRFAGYVSSEELERIKSEADIFTFPSRLEGYGMVICESMLCGLPVVCFDNSAMPYTVKDGVNGLLVADGNNDALADAIEKIVEDRDLRKRLSEGALATVDTFMTHARYRRIVEKEIYDLLPKK